MSKRRKDLGLGGNGGQYAEYALDEAPEIDLGHTSTVIEKVVEEPADSGKPRTYVQKMLASKYPDVDPSNLDWDNPRHMEAYQRAARHFATQATRAFGCRLMTVDDLAQEAIHDVLKRHRRGVATGDYFSFLNTVIRNKGALDGRPVRSEDLIGYRQLKDRIHAWANEHGSMPPESVFAQMREDIRDNYCSNRESHMGGRPGLCDKCKRHRPSPNFVENVQGHESVRSAGMEDEVFDQMVANEMASRAENDNYAKPGSYLDNALQAVESKGGTMKDARRMLWNALAETRGVPLVEPNVPQRTLTDARAAIDSEDSFQEALDAPGPKRDALLSPWANHDERDHAAVIAMLNEHRAYGLELWRAALIACRPKAA